MQTLYKVISIVVFFFFLTPNGHSQDIAVNRVEPPSWWVGMENSNLQLLVHGTNISRTVPTIDYPGIAIKSTVTLESPNYLFVNLDIGKTTKAGTFLIRFQGDKGSVVYDYELKTKRNSKHVGPSIDASDVMYLITPDRFSNGDTLNDSTDDTLENVDRANLDGRHGGDIKGIMDHLAYIEELGVTTLWLNPFLENDQPKYSYHGYGISDFYKTDPRFGTNDDFLDLVEKCHDKGIKMVMDQVFNHCGAGHWWMEDLPSKDWLNQWDDFTRTSYTNISISDPYKSNTDLDLHTKGWFDRNLPDLNQNNKYLSTYLIQNSIWWIEYADLDGIRMDTYPYPDKDVMATWGRTIEEEYPNFYLVAETSEEQAASLSYWNRDELNKDGYRSNINSLSDYPLYYAMVRAFGKDNDTYRLYEALAYDFLYSTPFSHKIFNGNHDVARVFHQLDKNKDKVKLSMAFMLTTRGIPQIYYGDEILLDGNKPDGLLRRDFPGGWKSDDRNAFSRDGRSKDENEVFDYVSTILKWRKNATEIHKGNLVHYKPIEDVYVYFRYLEDRSTMVIINNSEKDHSTYDLGRFQESLDGFSKGTDILTGEVMGSVGSITLPKHTAKIIQLTN
ncbi:glycoside hydrolase family 13 protein [Flagellimonas allohymeniacidonis]|uniref:Alpha-amlyase n=1 Tax=Flagellimonas allohymeniacidonis TaxID=2517819 RepID=A0A4Q8QGH0_9FLAO|nr:glycoside hydrolase family 13 protein [Allomuricauda hymeniacidonis]TAI49581.1 alpha-amlyase [Allomuricauda hymeniacidonis]